MASDRAEQLSKYRGLCVRYGELNTELEHLRAQIDEIAKEILTPDSNFSEIETKLVEPRPYHFDPYSQFGSMGIAAGLKEAALASVPLLRRQAKKPHPLAGRKGAKANGK